jgi:hypothetical protein
VPVKTVTIQVNALTDRANADIRATSAYFDQLRAKNPVELKVKLDSAQAIAESKILAKEMSQTVRDTVKLEAYRAGGGGGIGGAIGGFLSGGSTPLPGPLPAIPLNPAVAGGGAVAILASLPFLAQAAAGAVTFTLGTALAGIGVYAEKGVRSVAYQFGQLVSGKQGITATLNNISPAFGQALTSILSAARTFIPQFIRAFGPALDAIAGPFKAFGVEIAGTLASPAVAASLQAVGKAFGGILSALTPQIPGDVTAIADGITNIARAVEKNPKAFADFVSGLAHLAGVALEVIGWLAQVAAYLETHFIGAFRDVRDYITGSWDKTWAQSIGAFITFNQRMGAEGDKFRHQIANVFDGMRRDVATIWDAMWRNTISRLGGGIGDSNRLLAGWQLTTGQHVSTVVSFFEALPRHTVSALSGWGSDLKASGRQALNLLWEGVQAGARPVVSWFEGFAKGIVGIFKKIWGWFSPSSVMYEGGKALMEGLALGIKDHAHLAQAHAAAAAKGVSTPYTGAYGPGVTQWTGDVLKALKMEGLPSAYLPLVLYQMMTESGGNPNAINLTDINAQQGDPSRGLMQTIMSTFQAYHWPGTSNDIYDPLANIAAALNYAAHNRGFGTGPGQIGSGHGYAYGTGSALPGWAWVGERGPELVNFAGGERVYPAGGGSGPSRAEELLDEIAGRLAELTAVAAAAPAVTGAGLGAALAGGARTATYRALYS